MIVAPSNVLTGSTVTASEAAKETGLPESLKNDPRLAEFVPVDIPSPEDDALTSSKDAVAG
jgi:hypothetical protein